MDIAFKLIFYCPSLLGDKPMEMVGDYGSRMV
jgi:hypothetical protein